ncbi:hypothetical protein [Sporisorium scitamineum]|uniref:Uncharacterized protein n=1 Tax=Sporisorium scitamineum TaxID=49012 RepID=A0A0F7S5J9_9BASI|nr:hypothetical protein [Sporisorium scitamineum]
MTADAMQGRAGLVKLGRRGRRASELYIRSTAHTLRANLGLG